MKSLPHALSSAGILSSLVFSFAFTLSSPVYSQNEVGDALAPPVMPKLSATLTADELNGEAFYNNDEISLSISNSGKRALLLDGDNAWIDDASGKLTPLPATDIIRAPAKNTLPGDAIEVGASLGTMGAVPVAVDLINKAKNPGPAFYGKDEKRRILNEDRFGQRLVFPNEKSSGLMFFSPATVRGALIIPVYSHPDGARLGNFSVPIVNRATPDPIKAAEEYQKDILKLSGKQNRAQHKE